LISDRLRQRVKHAQHHTARHGKNGGFVRFEFHREVHYTRAPGLSNRASHPMPLIDAASPLCIVLFGDDTADRARQLGALEGCEVHELELADSLVAFVASGRPHVLVACGGNLPSDISSAARRPPIIRIGSDLHAGIADVILPLDASAAELYECVQLLARRCQILNELEQLTARMQSAFARNRWRSQSTWHGPQELLTMAFTDPLTGLFSRRHFDASLQHEFERAHATQQPLSLIVLDLDRFKPVNDTWGHHVGDTMLLQVAARLKQSTRTTDIVCRHGGDEFAIIAPNTASGFAVMVAERLREAISSVPFSHGKTAISLGCSAGVASLPESGIESPAEFLLRADRALFEAKRSGGDRTCTAG
jgi:diguanylate cyclase (GGDEF)-like protein